jgi:hypothetical protein
MSELRERLDRARRLAPVPPDPIGGLLRRRERIQRQRRITSAAVAFLVVAVTTGGLAYAFRGTGNGGRTPVGPAASGNTGPRLVAGPGEYYYWKTVQVLVDGDVTIQTWWGPDGSGRFVSHNPNPNYGTPPDTTWGPGGEGLGDLRALLGEDLSGLSTDPEILAQQLRQRSAPGGASPQPAVTPGPGQDAETGGLWRAVTDLLGPWAPHATPELRAALFDVAAGIPGVEDLDVREDPAGRPALALRLTTEGSTDTFFFDPDTHLFMASSSMRAGGGAPTSYIVVVAGGIVDSTDETPAPNEVFFPGPVAGLPEVD